MPRDDLTEAIRDLASARRLSRGQTADAFGRIVSGQASDCQIAAFLTALRILGETPDELAGAVDAVLDAVVAEGLEGQIRLEALRNSYIDTCGTGGDGGSTVNVSTACAIIVAAAGGKVAKHGNRSASGNSSSAEVLSELGVLVEAPASVARKSLDVLGITFLFAPLYHPAPTARRSSSKATSVSHDLQPRRAAGQPAPSGISADRGFRGRAP